MASLGFVIKIIALPKVLRQTLTDAGLTAEDGTLVAAVEHHGRGYNLANPRPVWNIAPQWDLDGAITNGAAIQEEALYVLRLQPGAQPRPTEAQMQEVLDTASGEDPALSEGARLAKAAAHCQVCLLHTLRHLWETQGIEGAFTGHAPQLPTGTATRTHNGIALVTA